MKLKVSLKYFNQRWNVYVTSPDPYQKMELVSTLHKRNNYQTGEWRLRMHKFAGLSIPLYSFGILDDEVSRRPGQGGEWSSRSSVVNAVFNSEIMEIAFDSWACAMDRKDVAKLVAPVGFDVRMFISGGETYWGVFGEGNSPIDFTVNL